MSTANQERTTIHLNKDLDAQDADSLEREDPYSNITTNQSVEKSVFNKPLEVS